MSTPGEENATTQQVIPGSKSDTTDYTQRAVKEVSAPVWNYIPREQLFDTDGLPHIDNLRKHLLKEGRVDPKDAIDIIQ